MPLTPSTGVVQSFCSFQMSNDLCRQHNALSPIPKHNAGEGLARLFTQQPKLRSKKQVSEPYYDVIRPHGGVLIDRVLRGEMREAVHERAEQMPKVPLDPMGLSDL